MSSQQELIVRCFKEVNLSQFLFMYGIVYNVGHSVCCLLSQMQVSGLVDLKERLMATHNQFACQWHWSNCPVVECYMSSADIIISKFG